MELRHLRYFVAVAERLSYRAAADALHIAQPAISQTVIDLEAELDVTLFTRSRRAVHLTPAGEIFLREAHAILARADDATRLAQRASRGEMGSLAIGFIGSATIPFLPSLIQKYRTRFPEVEITLFEMPVDQQIAGLRDGTIHIGFSRPLSGEGGRDLDEEVLYRDRLMATLPSRHPLSAKPLVRLDALSAEDFVLFRRLGAPWLFDTVVGLCQSNGFTPRIVSEPNMLQTVLTFVGSGVGVSLVPGCARNLWTRGVALRPTSPSSPPVPLCIAWNKTFESSTRDAFRELVHEHRGKIRARMEPGVIRRRPAA